MPQSLPSLLLLRILLDLLFGYTLFFIKVYALESSLKLLVLPFLLINCIPLLLDDLFMLFILLQTDLLVLGAKLSQLRDLRVIWEVILSPIQK